MIQLHLLEQFCAVADCEHMSKAAEVLHISQPTLSLNISRLESELGVKLFDRTGRNIVLNEYGKAYLPHVRLALQELQTGQAVLDNMRSTEKRTVYVADSILNNVERIIHVYMREHSNANVNHQTCIGQEMRVLLLQGRIDVGIAALAPDSPLVSEFDWCPVLQTRLIALMREDHPLAQQETVRLAQLRDESLEYAIHDFDGREAFSGYCARAGFSPNLVYTSIKPYLFNDLIREKGYISLLTEVIWNEWSNRSPDQLEPQMCTDGLVGIPIVEPECFLDYGILTRKNAALSKPAREFRDFAIEYMRENIGIF